MSKYCPIFKTTDAELKAYFFLDSKVKDGITPIFELTRSRRSKNNPEGDVELKLKKLFELCENHPFILDVTTEESLSNNQTTALLDNTDGFANWVAFVKKHQNGMIIPCIHYNPEEVNDVEKQIKFLENLSDSLACRIDSETENLQLIIDFLIEKTTKPLYLIIDSGFIHLNTLDEKKRKISAIANETEPKIRKNDLLLFPSSSFPKSVMDSGYGKAGATEGVFRIGEVEIYELLKKISKRIIFSDYGSIHPKRYDDFGKWTPRIDYPLDKEIFFYRNKPERGGYINAAKDILRNSKYERIGKIKTWGDEEIIVAATGTPNGKSPSHWIAVRMNLHITRQFLNL